MAEEDYLRGHPERVRRFRDGDPRELRSVVLAYGSQLDAVFRHGFTVLKDADRIRIPGVPFEFEIEELVQETFTRAFAPAARERYDMHRPYGPYLRTIARNVLISQRRRDGRELLTLDEPIGDEGTTRIEEIAAEDTQSAEELVEHDQLGELVRRFHEGLSDSDKSFVALLASPLQAQEICERLRVSGPTFRKRRAKLRTRLRAYLLRHGYDRGPKGPGANTALAFVLLLSLGAVA